ncbi:glutathione S-transferase [Acetobacter indonesiensis]|uniref:glutathione S-transferase n=1 Tax=Acetobacter indonesiensis TaxID=104101 RepID=UPI000A39224E|nr:glutathione S-transferase [Acetobacter indonesiensis]OUI97136.1 glutathione S-transferase [Acetobacter indonesiensis]
MSYPVLYSFRRCPYAMRARLALLASQTQCELREVKLAAKPAEMLAASPKGTVPVLVQADGGIIAESLDIMRWGLSRSDSLHWLDNAKFALIAANDTDFKHHLDRYKYATRYGSDAQFHQTEAVKFLAQLEAELAGQPFLHGEYMGLTDAAIAPFVRQFAGADKAWFATLPYAGVHRWLHAFCTSGLFEQAMRRLAPWQAGDVPVFLLEGQQNLASKT